MARHALPATTGDPTAASMLYMAAEWAAMGNFARVQACEAKAREMGCTDEEYGEYIIAVAVAHARAGRIDDARALAENTDDIPHLRTPLGFLKLSLALGNELYERGNPRMALDFHVAAKQQVILPFEEKLPRRLVAQHNQAMTRAMETLDKLERA